jgi:hypothetical protein
MENKRTTKDPFYSRINDNETAQYVFSYMIKFLYAITGTQLLVSILREYNLPHFISALITFLLIIVLHRKKTSWVAGILLFIAFGNGLLMLGKSVSAEILFFQFFIMFLCIRTFQATSYFAKQKDIENNQTA